MSKSSEITRRLQLKKVQVTSTAHLDDGKQAIAVKEEAVKTLGGQKRNEKQMKKSTKRKGSSLLTRFPFKVPTLQTYRKVYKDQAKSLLTSGTL
jgi:ribosomal protein L13